MLAQKTRNRQAVAESAEWEGQKLDDLVQETLQAYPTDKIRAAETLRTAQRHNPTGFAEIAIRVLSSAGELNAERKFLASLVATDASVAAALMSEKILPLQTATDLARNLAGGDPFFDVKLTRRIFEEVHSEAKEIPPHKAVRLLNIVGDISDCSRLTPFLVQLVRHPHPHVRSKTALLLGRSNLNTGRLRQFLTSTEPRIRANTIESLWGNTAPEARMLLEMFVDDLNQRTSVNALVGLCLLNDPVAAERLVDLAKSAESGPRSAAVWAMGEVTDPDMRKMFRAALETLLADANPKVQSMAKRSMDRIDAAEKPAPEPAVTQNEPAPVVDEVEKIESPQ